jgi:glycosyltransferase involved in cell wall biosynthesis
VTRPVGIDVVICTYNRAPILDRALEKLGRQQTSPSVDWRVVVVDNNCTDDTQGVVERHRNAGLAISAVHEPVQGLTAARRRGMESTTAPWVAFVDDDCLLDDRWVEEAARFAREHPDCGAFGGRVVLEWEHEPPGYVRRFPWAYASQDHGPEPKCVRSLAGGGMVVRRAVVEDCGWMSQQFFADRIADRLISGGDVELALRVGSGHELWYTPTCTLRHMISRDRTSFVYLRRLTFGLGSCQFFEDSMLWPASYRRWLGMSPFRAGTFARQAGRDLFWTLRGYRRAADTIIMLSFVSGWIAGMGHFARRDRGERDAILGCAVARPTDASKARAIEQRRAL